jgi:hypothetical protein
MTVADGGRTRTLEGLDTLQTKLQDRQPFQQSHMG